ncbi:MAG: LysM peptidoglycan-binding domain-containing protein [Gemmatimonadetes bacterium]|nr:LysM peptidoglycan-binding domain-containing protein [Gemmatimonadota bacterium]
MRRRGSAASGARLRFGVGGPADPARLRRAGPAGGLRGDRVGAPVRGRRGDTVTDLAARHGVSEARLRRLNALPTWYRLRPDQALRLPAA